MVAPVICPLETEVIFTVAPEPKTRSRLVDTPLAVVYAVYPPEEIDAVTMVVPDTVATVKTAPVADPCVTYIASPT